jgi:hypothetical protein
VSDDLIERYLDELSIRLAMAPPEQRRVLREVEAHLQQSREALIAAGARPNDAAAEAVARFGTAEEIALRFQRERLGRGWWAVEGLRLIAGLAALACLALVTVGLSGVIVWAMGALIGEEFVAGNATGVVYSQARCEQLLDLEPDAASCGEAALEHAYFETVAYRLAAGAAGLAGGLVLLVWCLATRQQFLLSREWLAAACVLFAATGIGLLLLGLARVAWNGSDGAGSLLAGALACVPAAVAAGWLYLRPRAVQQRWLPRVA